MPLLLFYHLLDIIEKSESRLYFVGNMSSDNDDDSRGLTRRGHAVAFPQQGAIDWAKVFGGSIEFGVEFLVRLSNGGIESLTVVAAETILAKLQLGSVGEQRAREATKSLKCFSSFQKVLYFGFGAKHVIRQLALSQEGLNCIVVCSALLESYSAEDAARILRALLVSYEAPPRLTPSLQQWIALVEACGAIFATSEFGLLIHQISRHNLSEGTPNLRFGSEPDAIADALKKLIAVSNGSLELVQFTGGSDCAWLAAFAAWMLDLPTLVQNAQGQTVFSSPQQSVDPKVIVTYYDTSGETLQVVKERAIVPSGGIFKFLRSQPKLSGCADTLSYGRVPWVSLLNDTFGAPMRDLLSGGMVHSFGEALGFAARICEAIATHDPDLPTNLQEKSRRSWEHINSSSYGRGFLDTARQFLPEIAQSEILRDDMEYGATAMCRDAISGYEKNMKVLAASCDCHTCAAAKRTESSTQSRVSLFCKTSLVGVVVELVQILSCLTSPVAISPTRAGLEWLHTDLPSDRKRPSYVFMHFRERDRLILDKATALFTGHFKAYPLIGSATACNGCCFFMNMLVDVSVSADRVKMLHIAPGCIEWNGNLFNDVTDIQLEREDPSTLQYEAAPGKVISSLTCSSLPESSTPNLKCDLIIQESVEGYHKVLNAAYRVMRPDGRRFMLGPSDLISRIAKATTAKNCKGRECGPIPPFDVLPVSGEGIIVEREALPYNNSIPLIAVLSKSVPAQLVSLSQTSTFKPASDKRLRTDKQLSLFLQDRQCLHCLLMSAIQGPKIKDNLPARKLCIFTG